MTYPPSLTLHLVALALGFLYVLSHLPGALAPVWFRGFVKPLPRSYPLGVALTAVATGWFDLQTNFMDLGELTSWRNGLMMIWTAAGVLTAIFVPSFLTARALGCLLLLSAVPIFDSAFLVQTPWRFVVTIMNYGWIVAGIALVYSPYLLRDALEFVSLTPTRCRVFCWSGVAFGVLLVTLALTVYPTEIPASELNYLSVPTPVSDATRI